MSYKREHYHAVLKPYQRLFGIENHNLTHGQWLYNTKEIGSMFDDGFLIADILGAFNDACAKNKWPAGTPFFHRVHDVLLERRHQHTVRRPLDIHAMQSIGAIMQERFQIPTMLSAGVKRTYTRCRTKPRTT